MSTPLIALALLGMVGLAVIVVALVVVAAKGSKNRQADSLGSYVARETRPRPASPQRPSRRQAEDRGSYDDTTPATNAHLYGSIYSEPERDHSHTDHSYSEPDRTSHYSPAPDPTPSHSPSHSDSGHSGGDSSGGGGGGGGE